MHHPASLAISLFLVAALGAPRHARADEGGALEADAGTAPPSVEAAPDGGEVPLAPSVVDAGAPVLAPTALPSPLAPVAAVEHHLQLPPFGIGPNGFFLGTVESGFQLRIRGVIQVDGRSYPGSPSLEQSDAFLVRRARPYIEGTVARIVDFRLLPDFGQGKVVLEEAWVDVHPWAWAGIRAGLMKAPFGLERLQAEQSITFIERGLPSDLAPDRDIGVDLHGDVGDTLVQYDLGIFDGVPDGTVLTTANGAQKDIEGRVFFHPFVPTGLELLRNVGIGVAVTSGHEQGTATNPWLAAYSSPGQVSFFSYLVDPKSVNTVVAEGERLRYAPQANAYLGPVGFYAEWIGEQVAVTRAASAATLKNSAFQFAGSLVLTGEPASAAGVIPEHGLTSGGWGALELGARVEGLEIDPETFPTYADSTKSASSVHGVGGVLNWYLVKNTKLAVQYEYAWFEGGAVGGARAPESSLIGRLQAFF